MTSANPFWRLFFGRKTARPTVVRRKTMPDSLLSEEVDLTLEFAILEFSRNRAARKGDALI
ncbi:hypothetical protein SBADM41S_09457 [Streptomyces badius]